MATSGNANNRKRSGTGSGNRNSGRRSSNSGSRSTQKRSYRKKKNDNSALKEDLILIAIVSCMIFIFLANIGLMGTVGKAVSSAMFGVFGFTNFVMPFFVLAMLAYWFTQRGRSETTKRIICISILFLCFGMICELAAGNLETAVTYSISDIFSRCASQHSGGGVIAGSLCYLFYYFMKMAGTILVIIAIILVCVIIISGSSIISLIDGNNVSDRSEEDDERDRLAEEENDRIYEEMRRKREDERAERRRQADEERRSREDRRRIREQELRQEAEEKENSNVLRKVDSYNGSLKDTTLFSDKNHVNNDVASIDDVMVGGTTVAADAAVSAAGVAGVTVAARSQAAQEASFRGYSTDKNLHEITVEDADYASFTARADLEHSKIANTDTDYTGIGINVPDATSPDYSSENFSDKIFRQSMQETLDHDSPEPSETTVTDKATDTDTKTAITTATEPAAEAAHSEAPKEEDLDNISIERERKDAEKSAVTTAAASSSIAAPAKPAPEYKKPPKYVFPPLTLLKEGVRKVNPESDRELQTTALNLQNTLKTFGVNVTIPNVCQGPAVTRYELLPAQGVKVSRIVALQDDIKLNLAAADIRIEAPIPGKPAIGIEVPNKITSTVALRDLFESDIFRHFKGKIAFAVGKDIGGNVVVSDIAKMPHMLIAGATGSGKSVCINTLIMSILFRYEPKDVKMIMIDPKIVELSVYNGIPHLLLPVVTDPRKASSALQWAVAEMTDRYRKFADAGVRDLKGYNAKAEPGKDPEMEVMPQIVIIVDELADLMMVCAKEVEDSICRLAQLARAAGIHLIIATQRPSVDVITGLIKANMPSRVAFAVTSGVDSRTILDMYGAEKLLGKGDMLFYPQGYTKPARVQGAFVSDDEVQDVVNFIKYHNPGYVTDMGEIEKKISVLASSDSSPSFSASGAASDGPQIDDHFTEAGYLVIDKQKATIGMLQRVYKIGFNRAARIMDQLCEAGVVAEEEGTKPRNVLMSKSDFESYIEENGV